MKQVDLKSALNSFFIKFLFNSANTVFILKRIWNLAYTTIAHAGNCVKIKRQMATKSTQAHRKSYCTDFDINPWAWSLKCNHINSHAFLLVAFFVGARIFPYVFRGEKNFPFNWISHYYQTTVLYPYEIL